MRSAMVAWCCWASSSASSFFAVRPCAASCLLCAPSSSGAHSSACRPSHQASSRDSPCAPEGGVVTVGGVQAGPILRVLAVGVLELGKLARMLVHRVT